MDSPSGQVKILVADDSDTDRMILEAILRDPQYEIINTSDGAQAVQAFAEHRPDIILMDALMPNMDGYEAAAKIKALAGEDIIPIIFLTSLNETEALVKCIDAGGDDFLTKPYNAIILRAKIQAFLRMRTMNTTLQHQRDQISAMNTHMLQEQEIAKKVFDKVAHAGQLDAPNLKHSMSPLSVFNGDVMLASTGPSGNMTVFLGDFTGHGLNAAIGAMPLAQTFYTMTEKGFSVQSIAREINAKLNDILPVGVFCCGLMADLDFENKLARIWHGGLPDCAIYRPSTGEIIPVESNHVPLGVLSNNQFNEGIHIYPIEVGDLLYLWSDGIIESPNSDGEMFGEERLMDIFKANQDPELLFDEINAKVASFVDEKKLDDDLSILEVKVIEPEQSDVEEAEAAPIETPAHSSMDWSLDYEVGPDSMRDFSALPLMMHILMQVPKLEMHRGQIYTMIAELLSNALEHGVLELNSDLKSSPQGFNTYYEQRNQRLEALDSGFVKISLKYKGDADKGELRVIVEDSGEGFDYKKFIAEAKSDQSSYSGRGIMLLRSICDSVVYSGKGNHVEVSFSA